MRWCRIRLVLLGLLLCVVHVVSGTCGQRFTDPASGAMIADVVIEGKVRKISDPNTKGTYNISVAVKKNVFKGGSLINKGRPAKTITIDRFKNGPSDDENCIGSVQKGRTYFFFLRNIADPKGLYFEIMAMPIKKNKKIATEIRKILCDDCAKVAAIKSLKGPKNVTETMDATLTCQATGNPTPVYSWYKNGVLLGKGRQRFKIKNSKRQSTLEIRSTEETDEGVYKCVASNILGESTRNITLKVITSHLGVPCATQTFCLNGGTCMHIAKLSETFCKCPTPFEGERCEKKQAHKVITDGDVGMDKILTLYNPRCAEMWAGHRCELLDGISVASDYNRQASLMFERTLIIIGIVIAVLVFIVICIVSYILAKKRRKQYENRRRRKAQHADDTRQAVRIDNRNVFQTGPNKEVDLRNANKAANSALIQPQQNIIKASSSPPTHQLPLGNFSHFPTQFQQTEIKSSPNGNRSEPRGRLAASSVYENVKTTEHNQPTDGEDVQRHKGIKAASISEDIEMSVLLQAEDIDNKRDNSDKDFTHGSLMNGTGPTDPMDLLLSLPSQSSEPPSSLSLSSQTNVSESSPLLGSSLPFEPLASPLTSPSQNPPQRFNDNVISLHANDTAVQPLLSKNKKHLPKLPYVHTQHPLESKSDKDLARYLPLSNKRQGSYDVPGYDIQENNRMLRELSRLSHSNTFPKPKMNGLSSDTISDSEEEDASEVPYEKQLDLYISEEDLDLSKENLVSSSFSSVNTPSRQTSLEERGIKLRAKSGLSRPGIRKHQSEESSGYSKFVNKSYAFLQDGARSHSLDNPPGRMDVSPDPHHLNSTVMGSPDVETYDNITQQSPQLQNHTYAYDPNDDSAPWDTEINRTDNRHTQEERDRLNRLKDVVPDQQAIPI